MVVQASVEASTEPRASCQNSRPYAIVPVIWSSCELARHAHVEIVMIEIRDSLLAELGEQQRRRKDYPNCTWIDAEIDFMHYAVNRRRSERGLPDVDRAAIVRVERWACGHSDYSSKFALNCAELVLG